MSIVPPSAGLSDAYSVMREYEAWWVGNTESIADRYRPVPGSGGVRGSLRRFWYGSPEQVESGVRPMHLPVAADIAAASSSLLMSQPIAVETDDEALDAALADVTGDSLQTTLSAAFETASVFGVAFLKVAWDQRVSNGAPFIVEVDPLTVAPEFVYGRMVGATITSVLDDNGQAITRHLEKHFVDSFGVGCIRHEVWVGSGDDLGKRVPLDYHPVTAAFVDSLDEAGVVSTGTPGLSFFMLVNRVPCKRFRHHPVARNYGASDLDGIIDVLDSIDRMYSSLMRDYALGAARILVPQSATKSDGPGRGESFDLDQSVYVQMKRMDPESPNAFTSFQPDIRLAEHKDGILFAVEQAVRGAGLSVSTFSENETGTVTATQVKARTAASERTRAEKATLARPVVRDLLAKVVTVRAWLRGEAVPDTSSIRVDFPAPQTDVDVLSGTLATLRSAGLLSVSQGVAEAHPDWDATMVDAEVARLAVEASASTPPVV